MVGRKCKLKKKKKTQKNPQQNRSKGEGKRTVDLEKTVLQFHQIYLGGGGKAMKCSAINHNRNNRNNNNNNIF